MQATMSPHLLLRVLMYQKFQISKRSSEGVDSALIDMEKLWKTLYPGAQ